MLITSPSLGHARLLGEASDDRGYKGAVRVERLLVVRLEDDGLLSRGKFHEVRASSDVVPAGRIELVGFDSLLGAVVEQTDIELGDFGLPLSRGATEATGSRSGQSE